MHATIVIQARRLGKTKPIVPDWSVPIPEHGENDSLTLRDLITYIVRQEVEAFMTRQEGRRFIRVLTEGQIKREAQRGKVDPAQHGEAQEVDPEVAVGTALLAFEDGLFYVYIDDRQYTRLEEPVVVGEGSRVTFLRLVALTGG